MPNTNHSYTQNQKIAAIIAATKRQWEADVVQSVREAMREEIAELVESKSREAAKAIIEEREDSNHRALQSVHWAALAYLFFTGLFILVFFTSLGDWLNLNTGWVVGIEDGNGTVVGQVNSSAIQVATRNMITVLGPLVIGIVIFLLTSVAAGRLKEYDRTIQDIRDKIDLRLAQFRSEQVDSEERTRTRILERVVEAKDQQKAAHEKMESQLGKMPDEISAKVQQNAKNELAKTVKVQSELFQAKITGTEAAISQDRDDVATMKAEIEGRFGHIAQNLKIATSKEVGSLSAVGPLKTTVQKLLAHGKRPEAILVVQEIIDQSRRAEPSMWPRGDLNDWFNLSAVLGRADEEALALEVCLAGLQQQNGAPALRKDGKPNWQNKSIQPHGDLIAHAVQYAKAVNDPRLQSLVEMTGYDVKNVAPRKAWGWRTYDFTMQALHALGRPDEAIALGNYFMKENARNPDADAQKVVQTLGRIMRDEGRRGESLTLLKEWLSEHPKVPASQVAAFVLDQEFGTVSAEDSLKMAQRALDGLVEENPTVNFEALIYQRGLCYDRLSAEQKADAEQKAENAATDEVLKNIDLALRDYKTGLNSGKLNSTYESNAQDQIVRLEMVRQDLLGQKPEAAEPNNQGLAALHSLNSMLEQLKSVSDRGKSVSDQVFDQVKNTSLDLEDAAQSITALHEQQPEDAQEAIETLLERMAEDTDLEAEVQKRAAHIRRHLG